MARWSRSKPKIRKFARSRGLTKKQKSQTKRLISIQQEHKHFDFAGTATSISATAAFQNTSYMAQGDTDGNRDGDECRLTNVRFRGYLTKGDSTNMVRLIALQWKPNNADTTPTAAAIIQGYAGDGTLDLVRPYHRDNSKLFKILYDRVFTMNDQITNRLIKINFSKKLLKTIQFRGGAQTGTNQMYFLFLSDSGASVHPSMTYEVRTTYTDS